MDEKLKVYEEKMTKTMKNLGGELGAIRAGRANPHVLDRIVVDYYGTPTPIQQVANVSVPEARMIQIQPWEKNMLKVIEKAIQISGADGGTQKRSGEGREEKRRGRKGSHPQYPPGWK